MPPGGAVHVNALYAPQQSLHAHILYTVTVTWNGTLVTGPILIYHDEVRLDGNDNPMLGDVDGPGALVCRSQTRPRVGWRMTNGGFFEDTDQGRLDNINQIRNGIEDVPSFARLSRGTTNPPENFDGLVLCRVDTRGDSADVIANFIFIGFYNRAPGKYQTSVEQRCNYL